MKIKVLFILMLIGLASWAVANDPINESFAKAVQLQTNGSAKQSIIFYQNILEQGQHSCQLYNNLGLAYIETKQLGKGIVSLERALKLNPNNKDAAHNLKAAQQQIIEPITPPTAVFFVRWWTAIIGVFSSNTWGILFLIFFAGGIANIALAKWQSKNKYKNIGIAILLFSLLLLFLGFQKKGVEQGEQYAIIIKQKVGLRERSALDSPEIQLIYEGVKVKILEKKDSWVYVQLPDHLVGWLPLQMLETI